MARFKLGEKVIIFNEGTYLVAILTGRSVTQKRRVFNVMTETGYEIPFIPVDDPNCKVYIDSEKTQKIIGKISTKLAQEHRGNVK